MKNIFVYYFAILTPIVLLILFNSYLMDLPILYIGLGLFYATIYRTYTDGYRLIQKGIIEKKDIWKLAFSARAEYFKKLYFSK